MNDHTEEIERYLEDEMPLAERQMFEQRLGEDAALAEEFALQKKMYQALSDRQALAFRQKLKAIRFERANAQKKRLPPKLKPLLILLAVMACSLVVWQIARRLIPVTPQTIEEAPERFPPPVQPQAKTEATPSAAPPPPRPDKSPQKLALLAQKYYQEHFSSPIATGNLKSGDHVQLDSISTAFQNKDYQSVLRIAETMSPDAPNYNTAIWTAAHAAFIEGNCTLALLYSSKISALKNKENKLTTKARDAELLLLLTYLKCGQIDDPAYQKLLKKCKDDVLHPAHQLAKDIKND